MRSTLSTVATLSVLSLATAQTFTECNPTKKSCAADPGLGTSTTTDFTKGKSTDWTYADATVMSYGDQGAEFVVKSANDAPTISFDKYIMFGKVSVTMLASAGQGIVSSFILESDDLDEIDWEWLGSTDSSVESNFFGKGNTTTYDRAVYHPIATPVETSHTYTIDWNKDAITWSIDGATVRTLAYDDPKTLGGTNYPQTPMKIKMGSWIGCADAAAAANPATQGTCEWAGGPVDLTKGPYTMSVASVVIEDYGCGGDYTYSDMTGSYTSIKSSGSCDGIANDSSPSSTSASATQTSSAAQSSSAAQTSSSATHTSSSSSTSGGLLIETSSISSSTVTKATSATAKTTDSSASASTTTTTTDSSTKSSSGAANGAASTTLATSATSKSSATSTSSTASPSLVQSSQANSEKPKHSFGAVELTVVALGLGLGYLVM